MAASMLASSRRDFIKLLTKTLQRKPSQSRYCSNTYGSFPGAVCVRLTPTIRGSLTNQNVSLRNAAFIQSRQFRATPVTFNDVVEVSTPAFAESISEGDVILQKAVGDVVAEDEVVMEIETEKTAIPVPAPCSGEIVEILVEDGATVTQGTLLYKLKKGAAPAADASKPKSEKPKAEKPKEEAKPDEHPQPKPAAAAGEIPTHPPPAPPVPTQPMTSKPASSVKPTPASAAPAAGEGAMIYGPRDVKRVKMSPMRRKIAAQLKGAQNECAMLTTFNEIDMSNIMQLRSQYKDAFNKKHGLKLGFMSAFLKASAYALNNMPVVNAVIEGPEIKYRNYIDISVAVATPKGLVVPVVRNVHTLNYADIERELNNLATKARDGQIAPEDMDGGTFTISNGGVYGSMFGTPIINPPQSAILGMHGIFDRPVAINGKVEVRPMMYVALTYDHRLIDGREGVTFLKKIKSAVEDPRIMLLDL